MNTSLTAVEGLEVGHYTDLVNATGCTVILCREGAVGGVDVRGGAPGTRETDLLSPGRQVERVNGIVLSGGSAFGLDAASGVMRYLAGEGIGYAVGNTVVPIVAGAILFDLGLITSEVRPGPEEGWSACVAANTGPVEEGSVGAGTGATVAKARGMKGAVKGGIGSATLKLPGDILVAAIVAVNAYGGVFDHRTGRLVAGPRYESGDGMEDPVEILLSDCDGGESPPMTNTTIGVVATDASLTREQVNRLATLGHDGLALTIRPCHTMRDGDTMFALATARRPAPVDTTALGAAVVEVTARAVLRAVGNGYRTGRGPFDEGTRTPFPSFPRRRETRRGQAWLIRTWP